MCAGGCVCSERWDIQTERKRADRHAQGGGIDPQTHPLPLLHVSNHTTQETTKHTYRVEVVLSVSLSQCAAACGGATPHHLPPREEIRSLKDPIISKAYRMEVKGRSEASYRR